MASAPKRFAQHTEQEIEEKQRALIPKNTSKANIKAARMLSAYLVEIGEPKQLLELSNKELDDHMYNFWFNARKQQQTQLQKENEDGSHYKASSLETMRHALKRHLMVNIILTCQMLV